MRFRCCWRRSRLSVEVLLAVAWLICGLAGSRAVQAATGDVRASFVPAGATGNGRGMAFDGTYLYYTIDNTIVADSNIYKITTAGALVATIPVAGAASAGGPLAWDGSALWTINYTNPSFVLLRIKPADGSILSSCDIAAVNPMHPAVTGVRTIGEGPDGLEWTGSQIVLSAEGSTGNWIAVLNPDCTITNAFRPPNNYGASGVAFDGFHLWHSDAHGTQFQTNMFGADTGLSFTNTIQLEDLAYDPVTFAPSCVIWGNQATLTGSNSIEAYEVPCGSCGPDTDGDGVGDACDPCTNVGDVRTITMKPKVAVSKINIDANPINDGLKISGEFTNATSFSALNPVADGAQVVIQNAAGATKVGVAVANGALGGRGTRGWKLNSKGNKWTFQDKTGQPVNGITKIIIQDRNSKAPNRVKVTVLGKKGIYPIVPGDAPLKAVVVLGGQPASAAGRCGETAFVPANCAFNDKMDKLTCKP